MLSIEFGRYSAGGIGLMNGQLNRNFEGLRTEMVGPVYYSVRTVSAVGRLS